ncbi:MAG: hypothetical protein GX456_13880 [Verrucomicrobia bacterium]|nr:hypothetical protein [Verrucomicrobiota bacterium]
MLVSKPPKGGNLTRRGRVFARCTGQPNAIRVPRLRGKALCLPQPKC